MRTEREASLLGRSLSAVRRWKGVAPYHGANMEGATPTYRLYDGLGSTTGLADDDGNLTDADQHDVLGAARSHTGSSDQAFRFTGEQQDADVANDLYCLRARYYDAALGRFWSEDPVPALAGASTQALNNYPYAANNPPNFTDPSGLWCPRNPEDCVPDPVEDFFTETVPDQAGRAAGAVIHALQYCTESGGRLWECYERYEIFMAGILVGTGGVIALQTGCVAAPVALGISGPPGWVLGTVLCAEGSVGFGAGMTAAYFLIRTAVTPWDDSVEIDDTKE